MVLDMKSYDHQDIIEHLEFIDGIQKAQQLALRTLLRNDELSMEILRRYIEEIPNQEIFKGFSEIQLEAMISHLNTIAAPTNN